MEGLWSRMARMILSMYCLRRRLISSCSFKASTSWGREGGRGRNASDEWPFQNVSQHHQHQTYLISWCIVNLSCQALSFGLTGKQVLRLIQTQTENLSIKVVVLIPELMVLLGKKKHNSQRGVWLKLYSCSGTNTHWLCNKKYIYITDKLTSFKWPQTYLYFYSPILCHSMVDICTNTDVLITTYWHRSLPVYCTTNRLNLKCQYYMFIVHSWCGLWTEVPSTIWLAWRIKQKGWVCTCFSLLTSCSISLSLVLALYSDSPLPFPGCSISSLKHCRYSSSRRRSSISCREKA